MLIQVPTGERQLKHISYTQHIHRSCRDFEVVATSVRNTCRSPQCAVYKYCLKITYYKDNNSINKNSTNWTNPTPGTWSWECIKLELVSISVHNKTAMDRKKALAKERSKVHRRRNRETKINLNRVLE